MTDTLFSLAGAAALSGWIALLASPWLGTLADRYASLVVPGVIAVAYTGLVLAFWTRAEGGFGSLDEVARLFETRELLLAGWLHYLAFDLFVGAWEVRTARAAAIPFLVVVPCLALTFLFGPAGLLAFLLLLAAFRAARPEIA
jgi:ABA4-like protein